MSPGSYGGNMVASGGTSLLCPFLTHTLEGLFWPLDMLHQPASFLMAWELLCPHPLGTRPGDRPALCHGYMWFEA